MATGLPSIALWDYVRVLSPNCECIGCTSVNLFGTWRYFFIIILCMWKWVCLFVNLSRLKSSTNIDEIGKVDSSRSKMKFKRDRFEMKHFFQKSTLRGWDWNMGCKLYIKLYQRYVSLLAGKMGGTASYLICHLFDRTSFYPYNTD